MVLAGDTGPFDTYGADYGRFTDQLYASIRSEAFGEDIGRNSWLTADGQRAFCGWLGVDSSTRVLEVASDSGGPALFTAAITGCQITGLDLHEEGVAAGNHARRERGLAYRARFLHNDARDRFAFDDGAFDAIICVDAINHIYDRGAVLREWHRLVRSGARILFTDPITVTGLLRREEMILRGGGMGEFVFTPPGLNESLIRDAGFAEVQIEDVSETPRWSRPLGTPRGSDTQQNSTRSKAPKRTPRPRGFPDTVALVGRERRLSRLAYMPGGP
jgi:SAM-dependent methyltransferase